MVAEGIRQSYQDPLFLCIQYAAKSHGYGSNHIICQKHTNNFFWIRVCNASPFRFFLSLGAVSFEQKKAGRIAIKLLSTAGTGFFYTATKNVRTATGKLALRKVRMTDKWTVFEAIFMDRQRYIAYSVTATAAPLYPKYIAPRMTRSTATSVDSFLAQGWSSGFKSHRTREYASTAVLVPGRILLSFCSRVIKSYQG